MADFIFKDNLWKVSHSPTHVYFVGGPFSQWFMRPFSLPLPFTDSDEPVTFNCAEQYMMSGKALLFRDYDAFEEIMAASLPKEQKLIGRRVNRFEPDVWGEKAKSVVTTGNIAKFTQHSDLREYLFATGEKKIVEGAWYDEVWGVKLAWDNPRILNEANWEGTNWLGECLMDVRKRLYDKLVFDMQGKHYR
jgi:hypothetical protein